MRRRIFTAVLAAMSLLTVSAARSPSGHQPGFVAVAATPRPPLLDGAALIGPVPSNERLTIEVTLQLPNPSALARFVSAVNDRSSPLFDRFLGPGEFGARFGPSEAEVAAVERSLGAQGLRPGPVPSDRLSIPIVATVGAIDRAFRTRIDRYRLPGGRNVFANSTAAEMPTAVASYVQAVLGLDDIARVHDMLMRPRHRHPAQLPSQRASSSWSASAPGPQPCAAARQGVGFFGGVTSDVLASHYGLTPLYSIKDLGAGVHVGLVEFEPHAASDISGFESCYGIHTVVHTINIDGGAGSGGGGGEAALDIEDVAGLAPAATIDVYNAPPTSDAQVEAEYSAIVNTDRDQVVSTSWGLCELDAAIGLITSEAPLFAQAAAQGQTVLGAAGDYGSTDCYNPFGPAPNAGRLSADDPGSQVYVDSVGGTKLERTDVVWNDSAFLNGAGGGAISARHCMPAYQDQPSIRGLISSNSKTGCGGRSSAYFRQTPDITADAAPSSGLMIEFDGQWVPFGGTSMAAPLWGAIAALVDASPFCGFYGSGTPGVRPPGLYAIAASPFYSSAFTDLATGNNDYTPSGYSGGLYPSTPGYDEASGLGAPDVVRRGDMFNPGLAALMCHMYGRRNLAPHISAVVATPALRDGEIPVLIFGKGFLPVPGAERFLLNGVPHSQISCATETECRSTLPASARAGVASLEVVVEGLATTPPFHLQITPAGFWLASAHGGVFPAGAALPFGGVNVPVTSPITGMASVPGGRGYWLVAENGAVFAKGAARFEGSLPGRGVVVGDIVAIAPTEDGRGYWLIGRDGGEFAFGDARYHGSLPAVGVHVRDIVGMVATADGGGYWLVGSDGGVFAFGDAKYTGSLPGAGVRVADITAIARSAAGMGYLLVGRDGGTYVFGGGLRFAGSLPGRGVHVSDVVSVAVTPDGGGYWLAGSDASVYAFGDAVSFPVPSGVRAELPIVAIAPA